MIGNDVVDLKLARMQSNWRRKGFLEKVFVATEQELIWKSNHQEQVVWTLWSMKEAAYKLNQRLFKLPRHLTWNSYQCEFSEGKEKEIRGVVKTKDRQFYTTSKVTSEYIFTTATSSRNEVVENYCHKIPIRIIKEELLSQVSRLLKVPGSQLSLQKNSHGIPSIIYLQEEFFSNFSLTDHGKFAAFSLSLTNC